MWEFIRGGPVIYRELGLNMGNSGKLWNTVIRQYSSLSSHLDCSLSLYLDCSLPSHLDRSLPSYLDYKPGHLDIFIVAYVLLA
jgi:hypothetical protein